MGRGEQADEIWFRPLDGRDDDDTCSQGKTSRNHELFELFRAGEEEENRRTILKESETVSLIVRFSLSLNSSPLGPDSAHSHIVRI